MQIKTVAKNISDKLTDWLSSITDENLREDVKKSLLVSGGSITSMLLGEPVNDYDIYLQDMNVVKRLTEYYIKDIAGVVLFDGRKKDDLLLQLNKDYAGVLQEGEDAVDKNNSRAISLRNLKEDQIKLYFEGGQGGMKCNENLSESERNYSVMFLSPNAISLSNDIQIVIRFHGTPEQIHKTFDFIHATNYFTFEQGLVRNLEAVESILTKQLKYQGSLYPVTSIIRAKKFTKRGWNVGAGELLKIMFQISQLDLTNPDVLEEQLIGVDVAYFELLITALRNKFESDANFKLTTEYFNAIIDKVFGQTE